MIGLPLVLSFILPLLQITSYSSVYAGIFPIIAIALMLDAAIVGLWYMAGVILNNGKVKSTAMGEFYQVFGTAILLVVLVGVLVIFANTFYSITSSTTLMSPSAIFSTCKGINDTSQLILLNSSMSPTGSSLLYSSAASTFPGFCNIVKQNGAPSLTQKIDYPLAASGVIIANVTNQTATNLNSFFLFDSYVGFLEHLSPEFNICLSLNLPFPEPCIFPNPVPAPNLIIRYGITPFAGYGMIYKSLAALGDLLTAALESFTAQLTISAAFIYIWPYLIFGGIVLRATPFTRKIGGLLIAIGIGAMVFFPLIFSIEYLALGHGLGPLTGYTPPASSTSSTPGTYSSNDIGNYYGFGNLFTNSTYFIYNATGKPYVTNFFVMPQISAIAYYGGCWPNKAANSITPDLYSVEKSDTEYLLLPTAGGGAVFASILALANHNPTIPTGTFGIPNACDPSQALKTNYMMASSYGIFGIAAYFLPIINLIIVLTGIIGISGMLGGDTSLAGLSRLV